MRLQTQNLLSPLVSCQLPLGQACRLQPVSVLPSTAVAVPKATGRHTRAQGQPHGQHVVVHGMWSRSASSFQTGKATQRARASTQALAATTCFPQQPRALLGWLCSVTAGWFLDLGSLLFWEAWGLAELGAFLPGSP